VFGVPRQVARYRERASGITTTAAENNNGGDLSCNELADVQTAGTKTACAALFPRCGAEPPEA